MYRNARCDGNYPEPRSGSTTGVLVQQLRWALARLIWGAQWEGRTG
ncbi:hypothetical protein GUY44_21125 [Pimelobacter simplex]|nr:hypothetical protein [Pimelobacter simplex]MCG8152999.1 hypothetical protein [Pimelobacter simplex]GEB11966.1 hypothetical protein NSI01_02810 [Pimelobacter simplex]SFN03827.1 hypothetical protein SAMN05421671_4826 [Pimelobacter simplex]